MKLQLVLLASTVAWLLLPVPANASFINITEIYATFGTLDINSVSTPITNFTEIGTLAPESTATLVFSVKNGTFGTNAVLYSDIIVNQRSLEVSSGGLSTAPSVEQFGPPGSIAATNRIQVFGPGATAFVILSNLSPNTEEFSEVVSYVTGSGVIPQSAAIVLQGPLSSVPLPSGLPMFITALLVLGGIAWQRKRHCLDPNKSPS